MKIVAKLWSLILCLVALTTVAQAQQTPVEVTTSVVYGDGITSGSSLVVLVAITSNIDKATSVPPSVLPPGRAPQGSALRLNFNNLAVEWDSVQVNPALWTDLPTEVTSLPVGELGPTGTTDDDVIVSPGVAYRDVANLGPLTFPATIVTPRVFYARFTVLEAAVSQLPYTITAGSIPPTSPDTDYVHLPWFTLVPPAQGQLDDNDSEDFTFIPTFITPVSDWKSY